MTITLTLAPELEFNLKQEVERNLLGKRGTREKFNRELFRFPRFPLFPRVPRFLYHLGSATPKTYLEKLIEWQKE